MYDARIGRWHSIDPMAESYYSHSPFHFSGNNPVHLIDKNGMWYTDYRNERGELLFKTDDGLSNIVVISDKKLNEFERKLNNLYKENKINDAGANKQELHKIGTQIENLKDRLFTGVPSTDVGLARGYDEGYNNKEPSVGVKAARSLFGIEDQNATINAGHIDGKRIGTLDREGGRINKLDPYSSLKNNEPLIRIPKPEPVRNYPGKGLPPKANFVY